MVVSTTTVYFGGNRRGHGGCADIRARRAPHSRRAAAGRDDSASPLKETRQHPPVLLDDSLQLPGIEVQCGEDRRSDLRGRDQIVDRSPRAEGGQRDEHRDVRVVEGPAAVRDHRKTDSAPRRVGRRLPRLCRLGSPPNMRPDALVQEVPDRRGSFSVAALDESELRLVDPGPHT
jgi:hypothetical protein